MVTGLEFQKKNGMGGNGSNNQLGYFLWASQMYMEEIVKTTVFEKQDRWGDLEESKVSTLQLMLKTLILLTPMDYSYNCIL